MTSTGLPVESPNELGTEFTIAIEYEEFITRLDLNEVLVSIDTIIESCILDGWTPEFQRLGAPIPRGSVGSPEPQFSYVGIQSIESGSIILLAVLGTVVVTYVANRFFQGVNQSILAQEIERSGRIGGELLGPALKKINDWAEQYVPKQRELGGRIIQITAKKKGRGRPMKM